MKTNILLIAIIIFTLTSCVQKSYNRKVTLLLDVSGNKDIKTVGIRGENKPFSWNEDVAMEVVKKDSLYKKTFEMNTGRLCTELKFTVNGEFELQDQENRKVYFAENGETIYKAKFNKSK
jgi:PBP1b-binding outer membrane lipoprotein LpoB